MAVRNCGCQDREPKTSYNRKVKINNDNQSWILWGIRLSCAGVERLIDRIRQALDNEGKPIWIATVNPEFMVAASQDNKFEEILKEKTTINVMDGVGLAWAKEIVSEKNGLKRLGLGLGVGIKILGGGYRDEVVTGVELMDRLCELAQKDERSVFFLGGWNDRAKRTMEYFGRKYPGLKVVGYGDENYNLETKVDILFVAYGMKKQEEWIDSNLEKLNCRLVMGVGRSFDYYSGDLKRAPKWIRRMGLEWLYSLYKEPKRWKRQLKLPIFMAKVMGGRQ